MIFPGAIQTITTTPVNQYLIILFVNIILSPFNGPLSDQLSRPSFERFCSAVYRTKNFYDLSFEIFKFSLCERTPASLTRVYYTRKSVTLQSKVS